MTFADYSTALVTGATSGIGAALVERLRENGLTVHAVARNGDRLAELSERTGAVGHVADLRDTGALETLVSGLEIDVLANVGGVSRTGNVLGATRDDIDDLVEHSDLRQFGV